MQDRIRAGRFGPFIALLAALAATSGAPAAPVQIEGLSRQAAPGFRTHADQGILTVRTIEAGSPAARAGLAVGDRIVTVDGAEFGAPYVGQALLGKLRGGESATLGVVRGGGARSVRFVPAARPLESIEGVESRYGSVVVGDDVRLRTLIARSQGAQGPLPAMLFTQWVSCGSIEYRLGSTSLEILAQLARRSGAALVRVERAGSGDSQGPFCHELDYDTEVAHYVEAFDRVLRESPLVDRTRVVVLGSSLGSTTAPLVARALAERGHGVIGVAVNGGGAVTYFERMLIFDRHNLERRPEEVHPRDIHAALTQRILFQVEYLLKGRSPDDIAKDSPAMAAVRTQILGLGQGEHYGRPYAYHQQAARRNFLDAWSALERARVLVVFGEFDQWEDRHGHELIATMVNRLRPGTARFVALPMIDHDNELHPTIESAYNFSERSVPAIEPYLEAVLSWLAQDLAIAPPREVR
jgi:hypothetical protein